MKKLGIGITISAAVLGGFVLAQSMTSSSAATQVTESTPKLITEKEAKEIALKKFNGTITEVDFDQDDQRPHYEFEIQSNYKEVSIDVDAKTGKATITDSENTKKEETASTKPVQFNTTSKEQDMDDDKDDVKVTETTKPKTSETQINEQKPSETNIDKSNNAVPQVSKPSASSTQKEVISKAEAIKIASTAAKGTVTKVELDTDDDDQTKTYELKFKDGKVEYDVEIDAYTGKIIEVDQDIED